jgi:small subunit ribosomal protein S1
MIFLMQYKQFLGRYMFVKEQQVAKKRAARVQRPLDFDNRLPLSALLPGMEISGIVISLTDFGAYVDVGSTVDGLLHVSQLSSTDFVRHPRQRLSPGDEITVRVRSVNPEKSKLHLTMLPPEIVALQMQKENEKNMDTENNENRRISVQELFPDDELWGIITRVTDYGGYVDVGAVVDGFCHFMDHPDWNGTEHPRDIMKVGDRVRVWVMDASHENDRIKLSAVRPKHLPGPRREL